MNIQVRLFAILRERVGSNETACELAPGATLDDLWRTLCAAHPNLVQHGSSVTFAVNREYVERSHRLRENDEVAIIPPVSGGI